MNHFETVLLINEKQKLNIAYLCRALEESTFYLSVCVKFKKADSFTVAGWPAHGYRKIPV